MRKREINNLEIELIGKKLIENDLLPLSEIDRIVANPDLFDLINKRIAAIEKPLAEIHASRSRKWIPAAGFSLACLAVLAVLASSFMTKMDVAEHVPAPVSIEVPDAAPDVARSEVPPKPVVAKLSADRAQNLDDLEIKVEKAAYRRPPVRKANVRKAPITAEPETEFYPVAYTGDPAETAGGGRIIRVDLERSSLFALGVNMPLENDHAMVKADLLIGMDGVTRAIRLVE